MQKCIRVVGVALLFVLTAAADDWPRTEIFAGYNFVRFNPNSGYIPSFNANGGSGQFVVNFNRWFGLALDAGAVNKGTLGGFNVDTTVVNFVAGPRVTLHNKSRFVPFFQALFGGAYATTSLNLLVTPALAAEQLPVVLPPGLILPPGLPVSARLVASHTGFAMLAGGGLDIKISRHVSFRPVEADYYLTRVSRLENNIIDDHVNRNNFRYAAGLNFMLGGEQPAPPPPPPVHPMKTCPDGTKIPADAACPKLNAKLSLSASPQELCQGETSQVNALLSGADSNQLNFQWSINGQPISQGHSLVFGSTGQEPGNYTVALTVNGAMFNPASAQTTITVHEYRPPAGTVQASPAEIHAGDKSTISANFTGQCGGPIQPPTFTASEGSIQGDQFDSAGVQFDATNKAEQRKAVTITAKAADNRSFGTATTTVEVVKGAVVEAIRLPDVLFDANSARVNNCGKRILLEQLRAYFERDSGGRAVLVGHQSSDEKAANLAEQRALNAAAVITAGTGVCLSIPQSQVLVSSPGVEQNGVGFEAGFCSSSVRGGASSASEMRRVEVWFVPSGGELPSSVKNYQEASALPISSVGCPK
jgi:outer membrane protein OmpA-like peptidoglycan-associated protein